MEKIASVLYGKLFEIEKGFKLAFLGDFEVAKIIDHEYLLKFNPLGHLKDIAEDLGIDKNDIYNMENLDPIYINSNDVESFQMVEENNSIILIMKDGSNHCFVYDNSEGGKRFLKNMTLLSFISKFSG